MAKQTSIELRKLVIYEVYIRNHTKEGSFKSIIPDLDRIKNLGVDIVWFMPIHPIGVVNRKGSLGCPYSISDYFKVNPEYGSESEFKKLIKEIHKRDMKCMIDVVYNHTSYDSRLYNEYPEAFYEEKGIVKSKVEDWTDVIDIDYDQGLLDNELISALKKWTEMGVDGFRCDVASLVPIDFWIKARKSVEKINEDTIWLAESVEPEFIKELRDKGHGAWSESEVFEAFDILYDYDVHQELKDYFLKSEDLDKYIDGIKRQDGSYQENYIKLKFIENHDNPRASYMIKNRELLWNWTAFMYFQKGAVMIYAGQESYNTKTQSLFERETIDWDNRDLRYEKFIKRLGDIKKELPVAGKHTIDYYKELGVVKIIWEDDRFKWIGLFRLEDKSKVKTIKINIANGEYIELLGLESVKVYDGNIDISKLPIALKVVKNEI